MSVYSPEANPEVSSTASPPPGSNDEIDLREYVQVIASWWREILLFTILVTGAAAAYSYYQQANAPVVYEAASTVVVARVISNVDMNSGLRTQVDASGAAVAGGAARRATLVALVRNGQIAQAVIEELAGLEGMEEMTASQLMRMVTASSSSDGNQGDLIEIRVTSLSAELAAAVANTWAQHYIDHVNGIYGQMPDEIFVAVENELIQAEADYQVAQQTLEDFMASSQIGVITREIDEKRNTITSLRSTQDVVLTRVISEAVGSRISTIAAYLSAQSNNRLLAFRREQQANRTLLEDLINLEIENRQLALQTEQNMRRQLFQQYAQAELDNRLRALEAEQTEKSQIFDTLNSTDLNARLAVFNERQSDRLARLSSQFERKRGLERILENVQALQAQVEAGQGANLESLALALTLLKTQMFVTDGDLPTNLQVVVTELQSAPLTLDTLATDLAALESVLQARIADADAQILAQTEAVFGNEDYSVLTENDSADDALNALVQETYLELFELGELATTANQADLGQLSAQIAAKYDALFQVGPLVGASLAQGNGDNLSTSLPATVPATGEDATGQDATTTDATAPDATAPDATAPDAATTDAATTDAATENAGTELVSATSLLGQTISIQDAIEAQYPHLFELGNLTSMRDAIGSDTELHALADAEILDLLQLQDLEDIPGYSALTQPTQSLIQQLDTEMRALQAQLEHETAERDLLTRRRNRASNAYDALNDKLVELELQRVAANREVSIGTLAIVPDVPLPQDRGMMTVVAVGGVSFAFAIFVAFVAHLLGTQPFLRRRRRYA